MFLGCLLVSLFIKISLPLASNEKQKCLLHLQQESSSCELSFAS